MKPFSTKMFVDAVVFWQAVRTTGSQGGTPRTFPGPGIAMDASVQNTGGKDAAMTAREGRIHTTVEYMVYSPTNPDAKVGDKFVWEGRNLTVEAPTVSKGIGSVVWLTHCLEMR